MTNEEKELLLESLQDYTEGDEIILMTDNADGIGYHSIDTITVGTLASLLKDSLEEK